jgi:hypothetical protein
MKRFLVFAFDTYYPGGGWTDFEASFDTLEEARAHAKTLIDPKLPAPVGNAHVVDLETGDQFHDYLDFEKERELENQK